MSDVNAVVIQPLKDFVRGSSLRGHSSLAGPGLGALGKEMHEARPQGVRQDRLGDRRGLPHHGLRRVLRQARPHPHQPDTHDLLAVSAFTPEGLVTEGLVRRRPTDRPTDGALI
eukprot:CAMPEP_0118894024 /NCGR_PEP_ID=MMETSP1166-20130328/2986_1 /TAXON_ID=1104430 /ORGANISM="Chrysoreinhardia sp, Strain CCMP3193" /LENGTH=113 /DNA_ID=CAMNT_0006832895 /DNA_START=33 /DNA_END=374 /DNA_ORIENTATION=+